MYLWLMGTKLDMKRRSQLCVDDHIVQLTIARARELIFELRFLRIRRIVLIRGGLEQSGLRNAKRMMIVGIRILY